jgi:hypothetical protein
MCVNGVKSLNKAPYFKGLRQYLQVKQFENFKKSASSESLCKLQNKNWASINTMVMQIVHTFCKSTLLADRGHSLAICSQRN